MQLKAILTKIGAENTFDVLNIYWENSVATLPKNGPAFLKPREIVRNREWGGLAEEADKKLLTAAAKIVEDPGLEALAWHCYRLLFQHTDYNQMTKWPSMDGALGELGSAFYLLVAMAMVPKVQEVHKKMGVDPQITRDTCQQIACFAGNYYHMTGGRLGIAFSQIFWLRHYVAGRLFRLGRFEYMLRSFNSNIKVYRHRESGHVLALAPDGVRYNRDGFVDGTAGVEDTKYGWTSSLSEDDEAVFGFPFSPLGYTVKNKVLLSKQSWECVLKQGDTTLDMHIPAGGSMSLAQCKDSMQKAAPFFEQYFPDEPFKSISCPSSWVFNPQIQQLKLSSENLARFQQELYLFPAPSSGQDGLWFIFLQDDFELDSAPRKTSLQRAVADFIEEGNMWRGGGMFFLTQDLPRFDKKPYQSRWPSLKNVLSIHEGTTD
ncbi:MAG: DUF5596 domain-containing protein [Firmicutes bacterium]|nr:DUF5596 domain-containing protein [Bacillota bacterium]